MISPLWPPANKCLLPKKRQSHVSTSQKISVGHLDLILPGELAMKTEKTENSAKQHNSKSSTDVRDHVNTHDQPSKSATNDDASAVSPPLIDDAKMHEMEAHLMKQLTSVMLTSPRNLSTLTPSKPVKKSKEDYKFWKTQPVPDLGEEITTNEPVEPDTPISEIRTEPYSLPKGFFWQDLDLNNPSQLLEVGFSHLSRAMTLQRSIKLYRLPDETNLPGFREMQEKDLPVARRLLHEYLARFKLHPIFSEVEFRHWFLPRADTVYCYVVVSPETGAVTDMCSFYSLPSSVMQNQKYSSLRAAYSFYNFSTKTPWSVLMNQALIKAKQLGFDVFNALDLMDNNSFLEDLKFGIGDGNLYYYLYNWRCPSSSPEEVGLVLQ
nr:unnamed protein product [Spirometra erinaceieuropaei]